VTPQILCLGEILVEVMRTERGVPFDVPGVFAGPYPSGAPAIFIDAAARLGGSAGYLAVCGDDACGRLNLRRLQSSGVDTSRMRIAPGYTTGITFVSYRRDGSREFLFHLRQSAAALLAPDDVTPDWFAHARWLHITGSSLGLSDSARAACYRAVELAYPSGAVISFDPNLRPELLHPERIRELCQPILSRAKVILPSGEEAALLTGIEDLDAACRTLLQRGPEIVVLKLGARGSKVFTAEAETLVPSIAVEEVDPTGAGDCFAAGFAIAQLEGQPLIESARFANIVGALSVTRLGPMEGAPTRAQVEKQLGVRA
jgi:sugar/nucleoside kinase (ribokinase family)